MAFFEWRKFNFFDLKNDVDSGQLANSLKDNEITVATSGNSHLVFGDSAGYIHLVLRSFSVQRFKAYDVRVSLAQQMRHSPLLITIGEDEQSLLWLKVFDTSRANMQSIRQTRLVKPATALSVHDDLQLMVIGFNDGSIVLYRGDITRDRNTRLRTLRENGSTVTGLAFKSNSLLFAATSSNVYLYNISHKDKEHKTQLDTAGCDLHCCILAESIQDGHFMVGRKDAVYCYTSEGRGPCYAIDGEKILLQWFRSCLVIVSQGTGCHQLTILDIQNKFMVFSSTLPAVQAVLTEWGALYILGENNTLSHLDEKDLQSKLGLLFKKNLYDVAIRIAKSQQYDADGLADIFRQYGDHLYSKGDHAGAVDQYIKTIGRLEASYVIRKFLDSQHTDRLTAYLQALHKQGHATGDHTTLLLNCYTRLNHANQLREFIMTKDREVDFDVDVAIRVCRQASCEDALLLAAKHNRHDWYLKIELEDRKRYAEALDYIAGLPFEDADKYMRHYGGTLIENVPAESTRFLKQLCTDYIPRGRTGQNASDVEPRRAKPEDYIHLFLTRSERLVEFLEYLMEMGCTLNTATCDTLLEHYLHVWCSLEPGPERQRVAQSALNLLKDPDALYDKSQALVVCDMNGFSEGVLHLYNEQKVYRQILKHHFSQKDYTAAIACCRKFGHQDHTLWEQALYACVEDTEAASQLLPEILSTMAKDHLLSPLLILDAISSGGASVSISNVRDFIKLVLQRELDQTAADSEMMNKYRTDTASLREHIRSLREAPVVFQGTRCSACNHQLELPSLHFLCQHSYHRHCFQSFSENENECPACEPDRKALLELLRAREQSRDLHETFHSQLERASDGFSLAAEYFGRGIFNRVTVVVSDPNVEVPKAVSDITTKPSSASASSASEGRVRQKEGRKSSTIVPIPEGRLRLQESRQKYSGSLEANLLQPKAENPFEDYDESKNPFSEEDTDLANPFREDNDYDKNLNPFFS